MPTPAGLIVHQGPQCDATDLYSAALPGLSHEQKGSLSSELWKAGTPVLKTRASWRQASCKSAWRGSELRSQLVGISRFCSWRDQKPLTLTSLDRLGRQGRSRSDGLFSWNPLPCRVCKEQWMPGSCWLWYPFCAPLCKGRKVRDGVKYHLAPPSYRSSDPGLQGASRHWGHDGWSGCLVFPARASASASAAPSVLQTVDDREARSGSAPFPSDQESEGRSAHSGTLQAGVLSAPLLYPGGAR